MTEQIVNQVSHTPGPWIASMQVARDGQELGWIIDTLGPRGGRIGWASRAYADTNTGARLDGVEGNESEANARLIAAAPELLAALRDLCDAIPDETIADDPPLGVWVTQARAALAKAEGREP